VQISKVLPVGPVGTMISTNLLTTIMKTSSTISPLLMFCRMARTLVPFALCLMLIVGGLAEDRDSEMDNSDIHTTVASMNPDVVTPEETATDTLATVEESCPSKCGMTGLCAADNGASKKSLSLYRYGGTAQAYKPGVGISNFVCSAGAAKKWKAASWPFTRASRKGSPRLNVTLRLWSCAASRELEGDCCCDSLEVVDTPSSNVQIWQASPDGRYSSLKQKNYYQHAGNDDECRTTLPIPTDGVASFSTVAPGSTGLFSGLGPNGWEFNPYGPPVIHMLANIAGHDPLLVDLPTLIHPKTLVQRDFFLPDLRGVSWVKALPSDASSAIEITSWTPNVSKKEIAIEVSLYLQRQPEGKAQYENVNFCESWIYGLPSSFFREPISLCAPSLMDFFDV
jgi:hypothetical protein